MDIFQLYSSKSFQRSVRIFLKKSVLLLALSGFAQAATIINVPGDYSTIQAALSAASAGDTVLVAPGDYPENLTIVGTKTLQSSGGAGLTRLIPVSGTVVTLDTGGVLDGFTLHTGNNAIVVLSNNGVVRNNIFALVSGSCTQLLV